MSIFPDGICWGDSLQSDALPVIIPYLFPVVLLHYMMIVNEQNEHHYRINSIVDFFPILTWKTCLAKREILPYRWGLAMSKGIEPLGICFNKFCLTPATFCLTMQALNDDNNRSSTNLWKCSAYHVSLKAENNLEKHNPCNGPINALLLYSLG